MNIVVPFKVVLDDQDIVAAPNGSLDCSRAKPVVSLYDLNAIEAAAKLGEAVADSSVVGISVGSASVDDSKLKKGVLSRGVDALRLIADDSCASLDARATAQALAHVLDGMEWDVVVCGDGSADLAAQQVDAQLAHLLGVPAVSAVVSMEVADGKIIAERQLESEIETVEIPLPAVVSVSPGIAEPRIPGMREILAAGKKPSTLVEQPEVIDQSVEVISEKAADQAERIQQVCDATDEEGFEQFVAALKSAL